MWHHGNVVQTTLYQSLCCSGDESRIEDCSHDGWGTHDCFHSDDARVICGELSISQEYINTRFRWCDEWVDVWHCHRTIYTLEQTKLCITKIWISLGLTASHTWNILKVFPTTVQMISNQFHVIFRKRSQSLHILCDFKYFPLPSQSTMISQLLVWEGFLSLWNNRKNVFRLGLYCL